MKRLKEYLRLHKESEIYPSEIANI